MDPSSYSQERQKKGLLEHKEASILTDTTPGNCYKNWQERCLSRLSGQQGFAEEAREVSSQECVGANQAEKRQDIPD